MAEAQLIEKQKQTEAIEEMVKGILAKSRPRKLTKKQAKRLKRKLMEKKAK